MNIIKFIITNAIACMMENQVLRERHILERYNDKNSGYFQAISTIILHVHLRTPVVVDGTCIATDVNTVITKRRSHYQQIKTALSLKYKRQSKTDLILLLRIYDQYNIRLKLFTKLTNVAVSGTVEASSYQNRSVFRHLRSLHEGCRPATDLTGLKSYLKYNKCASNNELYFKQLGSNGDKIWVALSATRLGVGGLNSLHGTQPC